MSKALTAGTPWRVILFFALPLLIGNVVQQLYQVADAWVVGRELGVNALAAVGSTGAMMFLLLGFAWGMTSGFAIPTAQAFGAGDAAGVRRSVGAGIALTGLATLAVMAIGALFARPLLALMQTPAELLDEATTFAVISFLGGFATMYFNYLAAIIRAIGDSRTPLVFLSISCVLNIGLVYLFVAVLDGGVAGAAYATVAAQAFSVALCVNHVRRRIPALHITRSDLRVSRAELGLHLRIGLPMGFNASIIAIGSLAVQVRLNTMGADAVAAWTTAVRVDGLAVAFLASIGLAVSTFAAQNYGAGLPARIRRGVKEGTLMAVGVSLVLALILITAGSSIIRSFVGEGEEDVVALAHKFLVINGVFYWALGMLFTIRGALQGMGRTLIPTATGVIELVMRVVAAIILGGLFGFVGVAWGNPLAWLGAVVLLVPAWFSALRALRLDELAPLRPVHAPGEAADEAVRREVEERCGEPIGT
ncbi:MATE family efflux transporter [Sanguibacter sp. A247]|uniref:MATE family efflux transporter n=1 Tax=unclassified Sanguibacter TaxID=2645534 RepID=UPI003FD807F8